MKKLMSITLSYFLVALAVLPHSNAQQNGSQLVRGHKSAGKMSANVIRKTSGTISAGGRTLVTDEGNRALTVDNPDALKGYEGRRVTVKALVAKNVIHVLSVKKAHGSYAVQTP